MPTYTGDTCIQRGGYVEASVRTPTCSAVGQAAGISKSW